MCGCSLAPSPGTSHIAQGASQPHVGATPASPSIARRRSRVTQGSPYRCATLRRTGRRDQNGGRRVAGFPPDVTPCHVAQPRARKTAKRTHGGSVLAPSTAGARSSACAGRTTVRARAVADTDGVSLFGAGSDATRSGRRATGGYQMLRSPTAAGVPENVRKCPIAAGAVRGRCARRCRLQCAPPYALSRGVTARHRARENLQNEPTAAAASAEPAGGPSVAATPRRARVRAPAAHALHHTRGIASGMATGPATYSPPPPTRPSSPPGRSAADGSSPRPSRGCIAGCGGSRRASTPPPAAARPPPPARGGTRRRPSG
jgi:hypothetical protein